MSRIKRQKSSTGIYHVILRGINKEMIFQDNEDKEKFIELLKKYKEVSKYELYAFCIMDNHVHILIKEGKEPLSKVMKRIGVSYVYWYNSKYERKGHLFQDRYKSEPVEDDKYLLTVIRYIHQNPLKAGIVDKIDQYQWSSYHEYIKNTSKVVDTQLILGMFANKKEQAIQRYKELMNERSNEECLEIKQIKKLNDKEGLKVIKQYLYIQSIEELKKLNKEERDACLRKIKAIEGLSIRQIARITGFTVNIVAKA
ncbi:transposase [Caloranaerobacter sp. TR13]|uniref:transposase n=1 Tax=Caloranaerobacter sp. TR13 TaxID=1302151 RepID=UPI0006D40DB6|nr:transposase [Caloranaerobacter sp. TR13]KPU27206.1 transposase [Caloranaerobacter sp. TR13]